MIKFKKISEGRINEFLGSLFNAIAKKKGAKARKKLEKDPQIKAALKKAEDSLDLLKGVVISRLSDKEAEALAKKIKKFHLS
jgi:hypothetical protein